MRKMTSKEIKQFINAHTWATLCTVGAERQPYAVEFSYFMLNGCICGLIKPNGMTAKNISSNPNVCLKMCRTDESCRKFTAISVFGKGEFVQEEDGVIKGWDLLEERLKLPKGAYAKFKEKFINKANKYPMFRVKPAKITGVTTAQKED